MKKILFFMLLSALCFSCSRVEFVSIVPTETVVAPPPASSAYNDSVWIGNEYRWSGNEYVVAPAHWEKQQGNWVPGYWLQTKKGYRWVSGHWR